MKSIPRNDRLAKVIILSLSAVVFSLVVLMRKIKLQIDFGFDTHLLPAISAIINSVVALLLLSGLLFVRRKMFLLHKRIMLSAVFCSVLFLVTYVMYHFTTVETSYGGIGPMKAFYYFILFTHITLAGLILPFILFAVYRGLTGEYDRHKKLTRWVWPVWFYVSVTGVIVYLMISPYY